MVFTNILNPRSEFPQRGKGFYKMTIVKRGATLGANSTIVCGNTIGRYAFVGAGAVVTRDIPDFALVYGNPADIAGWMCVCGTTLAQGGKLESDSKLVCAKCERKFISDGLGVQEL